MSLEQHIWNINPNLAFLKNYSSSSSEKPNTLILK